MGIDTVEARARSSPSRPILARSPVAARAPTRARAPFIDRGPIRCRGAGSVQALAYVEPRGEQLEAGRSTSSRLPRLARGGPKRELAALAGAASAFKGDIQGPRPEVRVPVLARGDGAHARGKRSANLGHLQPAFAGNRDEDQWVTNFTESFPDRSTGARPGRGGGAPQGRGGRARRRAGRGRRRPQGDRERLLAAHAAVRCRWARCGHALGPPRREGQEGDLRARAQDAEREGQAPAASASP